MAVLNRNRQTFDTSMHAYIYIHTYSSDSDDDLYDWHPLLISIHSTCILMEHLATDTSELQTVILCKKQMPKPLLVLHPRAPNM